MTRPLDSTPTAPSRDFTATTSRSASTPRDGTHCLHGFSRSATPSRHPRQQCRGVPSHVPHRSSRPGSRRLHARTSASEILAARSAIIAGAPGRRKSYGKGSVQGIFPLSHPTSRPADHRQVVHPSGQAITGREFARRRHRKYSKSKTAAATAPNAGCSRHAGRQLRDDAAVTAVPKARGRREPGRDATAIGPGGPLFRSPARQTSSRRLSVGRTREGRTMFQPHAARPPLGD